DEHGLGGGFYNGIQIYSPKFSIIYGTRMSADFRGFFCLFDCLFQTASVVSKMRICVYLCKSAYHF
ncbi:MAG: hypothetical protein KDE50_33370, partial [Caldilineaceae bacterium]|nr:hypothetical protein [Caldilineaceae bacterium]